MRDVFLYVDYRVLNRCPFSFHIDYLLFPLPPSPSSTIHTPCRTNKNHHGHGHFEEKVGVCVFRPCMALTSIGYKPVRPPPGTPTYGGRMSVSSPSPFEMDGTPHTPNMDMGDSVASVQSNILRSKLSSSQNELSRVKRELKTANEKALQLSLKLNEEQVGKVALTKKYAAVVERVKEFDERMRDAEQVMKSERQHHKELQKNTEQLKEKLRQSQQASDQQAQLIRKMQKEREDDAKGYRENLDRRSETAEAIRERQTQFVDFFTKLVATSMERLSDDKDSNDVLITVTTSELSSTITEQQQLLQKLALENESMRDSLQFLIREVEDESNTLVLTLLKENKEVWSQLNSCRAELARFRESDRSYSQKLHETRQQDQIDALMQENAKLETRVQKSNDALKVHMEKGRDHERTLQQIMETLQAAEQEKGFLTTQVADFRSSSESLRLQITTLEGELEGERRNKESFESLQSDVAKEKKRHEASKDQHKQELLEIKTEYQRERSKFVEEIKHQHKQLHEATIEADRHQREFTRLTEQLSVTKKNAEDERHSSLHQIREELSVSKAMYERELEEARRDLSNSTQELTNLQRTFDKERVDSTSMRLEFGSLTKSVVDLKAENQTLHEEVKRTLERSQEKSRELEQRKAELADQEAQLRQIGLERERISNERHEDFRSLEEEAKRLKAQLLSTSRTLEESENRVISLERENHSLIMLNSREGRRSREELEKDKDMLSNENQRILRQYEEVNEQNSRLLGELSRLREKCSNMQVLQDRIEMYKRQLDSLEHQSEELQDAREAVSRAEGETDDLRRERDAMQARLDSLTDDSGALQKKELELDQCVEAADQQIRRLEQQMERASRYTASLPRSSGGVSPTSTFDVSPNKFY